MRKMTGIAEAWTDCSWGNRTRTSISSQDCKADRHGGEIVFTDMTCKWLGFLRKGLCREIDMEGKKGGKRQKSGGGKERRKEVKTNRHCCRTEPIRMFCLLICCLHGHLDNIDVSLCIPSSQKTEAQRCSQPSGEIWFLPNSHSLLPDDCSFITLQDNKQKKSKARGPCSENKGEPQWTPEGLGRRRSRDTALSCSEGGKEKHWACL